MVRFIIHGGYGKTATTFLQENIFPHLNDVLYLGKRQDLTMLSEELRSLFHFVFPSFYGMPRHDMHARNSSLLIPLLGDVILRAMEQFKKDTVLLSNECLFDYAHHNAELNQLLLWKLFRYLEDNYSEKMEFKVMMTIRNQKDALKSLYAFDYTRLKDRFDSFQNFLEYGLKNKHKTVFGGLYYDLILEDMQTMYGPDNVRFFVYEKMEEDIKAYLYDIFNFIGTTQRLDGLKYTQRLNTNSNEGTYRIREVKRGFIASLFVKMYRYNKSMIQPLETTTLFRYLKKKIESYAGNSMRIVDRGHIHTLPQALIPAFDSMYKNSNRRLAQMLHADLELYGYTGGRREDSSLTQQGAVPNHVEIKP